MPGAPGLMLTGLAAFGSVTAGVRAGTPWTLRWAHLVMAAAMLTMTLTDRHWAAPAALVALTLITHQVGRRMAFRERSLPCLVDLIAMIIVTAGAALPHAPGDLGPSGHASEQLVTTVGMIACACWAVYAAYLQRSIFTPIHAVKSVMAQRVSVARDATARPGGSWLQAGTSVTMAMSMAVMLATTG